MEIAPQDLGEKWRIALLERRALSRVRRTAGYVGTSSTEPVSTPAKRSSQLARYWLKSAQLPEKERERLLPLLTYENTGVSVERRVVATFMYTFVLWCMAMVGFSIWNSYQNSALRGDDAPYISPDGGLAAITIIAPLIWIGWSLARTLIPPRRALRRINTDAVTREEIEAFLPTARGELDRAYLNTLLETQRQTVPTNAQVDLRSALRAIGDTVSVLPGEPLPSEHLDPQSLRQAAQAKRLQADAETDTLVNASLLRQAEATDKQALIVEQSGTAAKRSRARYDEVQSQLSTLRSVLAVYASPETAARLEQATFLSDTVRRVAGDATASAQAKRELDDSELAALYGKPVPAPEVRVGGTSVGAHATPTITPPAPTGKWWRGEPGGNGTGT